PVRDGSGALAVTTTGTGPADVWIGSGSGPGSWTSATPATRYSASTFVRGGSGARTVAPMLVFYDSAGTKLAGVFGQTSSDTPGTWTGTHPVVAIAPSGTAWVVFGMVFYGTA